LKTTVGQRRKGDGERRAGWGKTLRKKIGHDKIERKRRRGTSQVHGG